MKNKVVVIGRDHHNTLGVVVSLGRVGVMSYTLVIDIGLKHSYVKSSKYVIDGWRFSEEKEILDCLLSHFNDREHKAVVITTSDDAASFVDENRDVLSPFFYVPGCAERGQLTPQMSKEYLRLLADEVGLNTPKTQLVANNQCRYEDVDYPCITKAISSIEGGKSDICICHNQQDLNTFITNHSHCSTLQVQSFVTKVFEFQLLGCSINGGDEIVIPGRTHIIRPNGYDNTFFLEYVELDDAFSETLRKTCNFIRKTGYSGTFSVEFIHGLDGKNYFLEMNFRNDGNAICVTEAGVNLPLIWYLSCIGQPYQEEMKRKIHPVKLLPEVYCLNRVFAGEISMREYRTMISEASCFTTKIADDPVPFRKYLEYNCLDIVKGLIKAVLKRWHIK